MDALQHLSGRAGDRTSAGNALAADLCLNDSEQLVAIAGALNGRDAADCAEVFTMVAQKRPELVAPYAEWLVPLLEHRHTKARWEATHALALVAGLVPELIASILPRLSALINDDPSIIVRDYAVDAVANFSGSGPSAARAARPILMEAVGLWAGKHVQHALRGLVWVAKLSPQHREELASMARDCLSADRPVVRKAAKALLKECNDSTNEGSRPLHEA